MFSSSRSRFIVRHGVWIVLLNLVIAGHVPAIGQSLPDAPEPQVRGQVSGPISAPCPVSPASDVNLTPVASHAQASDPSEAGHSARRAPHPCAARQFNWYRRFLSGPGGDPLTPAQKAWLASRNVLDPFEVTTILGDSAIATSANSHSAYGPGTLGFLRYAGVSFTQEMTVEFVDTFAICSITRQDPHYHRQPNASIFHRAAHAAIQTIWTRSDEGKQMPNYANLLGFGIDDEIANLYVPGRETSARASAERYATGLLAAPVGNLVSEFVPSIASHIHIRIVIIQRIINEVAKTSTVGAP